jgi:CRISPR-associated protein Csm1
MSEQILLQGKILGIEEFLLSPPGGAIPVRSNGEELLAGRSQWITLLCEVLPRALLAEFGLARILLGSSGGGQFLLVLPGESRGPAEEFLRGAARQLGELSGGCLTLLWSVTENLGDWTVVRKRLNEELRHKRATPLAGGGAQAFLPFTPAAPADVDAYFAKELGLNVREAAAIGWSPETPAMVQPGAGKHTWNVTPNLSLDGITPPPARTAARRRPWPRWRGARRAARCGACCAAT